MVGAQIKSDGYVYVSVQVAGYGKNIYTTYDGMQCSTGFNCDMLLCKVAHADKILKCNDIRTCKNEGTSLICLFMVSYRRSF